MAFNLSGGKYKVVNAPNTGKWKVLNENDNTISSHNKKSAAKRKAKKLAKNKADRTGERIQLEIYKKGGGARRTTSFK